MKELSLQQNLIQFELALQGFCSRLYPDKDGLHDACRYAMSGKGKRVRPLLAMLSCEALGGQMSDAWPPAITIEMIHTYSLIHDDLPIFDNDSLRRGQPTLHIKYDEQTAVLAGDALLTDAWTALTDLESLFPLEGHRRLAMISEISSAAGAQGMALGQFLDLYWAGRNSFTAADLERVHLQKTGAMIAASCVSGALAVTGEAGVCARLREFGRLLGLTFQIIDDVLDLKAGTGKSSGKDVRQKKLTYRSIMSKRTRCILLIS